MAGIFHGNVIATANSSLGGKISSKNEREDLIYNGKKITTNRPSFAYTE